MSTKYDDLPNIKYMLDSNLKLEYKDIEIEKDLNYIKNSKGTLEAQCNIGNKLIYKFQQDIFYKKEKELFKDPKIRENLLENRQKYLNKSISDLSITEVLRGFKISRIWNSYSLFSPLWIKYFIEKYNINCIYDPCGGWGQHMLGGWSTNIRYIYNDLSISTYKNYLTMCKYLNKDDYINDAYNLDARETVPDIIIKNLPNDYAWFSCPPYFNLEHYECGDFKDIEEYEIFLAKIINIWENSKSNIFGIIIKENFEYILDTCFNELNSICLEKSKVNIKNDHMNKSRNIKKVNEYLYVYKKEPII